jgi:hypothetical protein
MKKLVAKRVCRGLGKAAVVAGLSGLVLAMWNLPLRAYWINEGNGVCIYPSPQILPQGVSDGSGGVILAWRDERSGSADIYAQRIDAGGNPLWVVNGVAVCTVAGAEYDQTLASDGSGGAIVVWYDQRSGYGIYGQRMSAAGVPLWTTNGIAICGGGVGDGRGSPRIVSDGSGGGIVSWTDNRAGNLDIYVQRVTSSGTVLWGTYGTPICTVAGTQDMPRIVSDGSSGAIVAWRDLRSGVSDIYAQRVSASGVALWTAGGVPVCAATGLQTTPEAAADGAGGAFITWIDERTGAADVYAQRLNSSGTALWTANGAAVCTGGGYEYLARLIADGSGGTYITWLDQRSGQGIYAQRMSSLGVPQWIVNGVAVCSSDPGGGRGGPAIATDGSGGAIIVWRDQRSGYMDLYAQRVDGAGASLWMAYGAPICTAANAQDRQTVVADGVGGAFVAWTDWRSGNEDVYALRVGPAGSIHTMFVDPASSTFTCAAPTTVRLRIDQIGNTTQIRGYDVLFHIDPAVAVIADPSTDIAEGAYLRSAGGTAFYGVSYGGGVYGVSCAILGGDVGATGDGEICTIALTPVAQGTSAIDITSLKLRNLDNDPLAVDGADGIIRVDCAPPTMEPIAEAENQCHRIAPVFSNFGFDDDANLDLAEYKIDSGSWTTIFSGIDAASWDSDGWSLPGFAGLSEGAHTVYFRVKDDAGYWNGEGTPQPDLYSWAFVKDTVAPAAPTSFLALPGHGKVHLTWTNPTGDASWAGVEIRRVAWGDYPQYGTPGPPAPSYPANQTQGVLAAQTALSAYDDPVTQRDIYYYAAFSYDCAGNYSAATSTSRDRSTNYWLGDISPAMTGSGDIQLQDLALFALTFAQVQGGPAWNAEADFGPTDDHYRFGIPLPDNAINFEDLMIFAMNYGHVSPSGTSGGPVALASALPLGEQVSFRLVLLSREGGKATYAVVMENASEVLKGFSLRVGYGMGNVLEGVTVSRAMTGKAPEHFFGVIERESGVVEICVAALGENAPFEYAGEVARVVVRETTEGSAALKTADLRDLNNNGSEVTLPGGGETPYVPVTTALMQNHPNPFNPTTTIVFDVATAGAVRIEIYDVSGSLVRTLVNEEKGIGRHVATWDGRDGTGNQVHTGVYFCRMTAPGYTSQAKKMLLLK